jgi:hypothetical protein
MSNFDLQVADVLEKLADYIEAAEGTKIAEQQAERSKMASELAERFTEMTGEEMDAEKLADLDPSVMKSLEKIAGAGSPDSLGEPENKQGTVKTAGAGMGPGESALMDFCTT